MSEGKLITLERFMLINLSLRTEAQKNSDNEAILGKLSLDSVQAIKIDGQDYEPEFKGEDFEEIPRYQQVLVELILSDGTPFSGNAFFVREDEEFWKLMRSAQQPESKNALIAYAVKVACFLFSALFHLVSLGMCCGVLFIITISVGPSYPFLSLITLVVGIVVILLLFTAVTHFLTRRGKEYFRETLPGFSGFTEELIYSLFKIDVLVTKWYCGTDVSLADAFKNQFRCKSLSCKQPILINGEWTEHAAIDGDLLLGKKCCEVKRAFMGPNGWPRVDFARRIDACFNANPSFDPQQNLFKQED